MRYGSTGEIAPQREEPEESVDGDFVELFADEEVTAEHEPLSKREEPDADDDAWLYECSVTAD